MGEDRYLEDITELKSIEREGARIFFMPVIRIRELFRRLVSCALTPPEETSASFEENITGIEASLGSHLLFRPRGDRRGMTKRKTDWALIQIKVRLGTLRVQCSWNEANVLDHVAFGHNVDPIPRPARVSELVISDIRPRLAMYVVEDH